MGVHFTVTVDHDIHDTSLKSIRSRFSSLQPIFNEISSTFQEQPDRWQDVTEPGWSPPDHFYAPAGFSLQVGSAALRFHHCTRFSAFIDDLAARELMRRFSKQLAYTFGQKRALYAPCEGIGDDISIWLTDGLSLSHIEARLQERATPSVSIEALAKCSGRDSRYYIDKFDNAD